jgi:hypothetical protein
MQDFDLVSFQQLNVVLSWTARFVPVRRTAQYGPGPEATMVKTRRRAKRPPRRAADGALLRLGAFREAYYDALYALEMEEIEQLLRDPKIRELLHRQTKELLQEMLKRLAG